MAAQSTTPKSRNDRIHEMSTEEGKEMFDSLARSSMNMTGDEFIRAWESGEFDDQPETSGVIRLVLLIPFTR
ncbi:hypothetical protein BH20CHL1_BH20CHL1_10540 [soil metagenome]